MIYLQPHSGLANRIRVIVSGLSLSDQFQQKLILIWRKDSSLFCDFTDLFESDKKIILKKYSWGVNIINYVQNAGFIKALLCNLFSIDFCFFDNDVNKFVWSTGTNDINLSLIPKKASNFYFSTCHEFYFRRSYLNYLRPQRAIQERIDSIVKMFTNETIGVHIRRTDHSISIEESPLESFIQIMRLDFHISPGINFFLSTDDKDVESILIDLFPGKIITYPKDYSRTNSKGIQDAMVDLYSLSATCRLYGSSGSSFSDIAARIGNIPLKIILKS